MKLKIKISLFIIIIIAAFLRLYKLDQVPPSLSWDEAAVGYNAFTIANWGKDEWGNFFPLAFKSFGDDKNPVHIYSTALSVRLFGLSEFTTRLPMAIYGVLNVLLLFYLARLFFKSDLAGIIAAFFLAVSPYNLQFSRFNHEANVALFFFMLGLYLFVKSVGSRKRLWLSFLCFDISIISYHSAKVVVPLMIALLFLLYFKKLWEAKLYVLKSSLVLVALIGVVFLNPALLGMARMQQSSIPDSFILQTDLYKKTNNMLLGKLDMSWQRYKSYYTIPYLFISGDVIARHSTGAVGEFYKIDALFLIIGLLALFIKRSKATLIILSWALLAPIPASVGGGPSETGHAARALFMMGSWHLVAGLGAYSILLLVRKRVIQIIVGLIIIIFIGFEFKSYMIDYYGDYIGRQATEWQYGMKEAAIYAKEHNGYSRVYMTEARSQPYIFFLYYLQTPLPDFLKTVEYNTLPTRPSNLVASFDRYQFAYWDPIESMPTPGILYIVTPSLYDGLRHRDIFDVKKKINYPNGSDGYFIVSYP